MTRFYLKERKDTLAYKNAPTLPAGFFATKKKEEPKKIMKKI
jgi:hypothetical protein